MRIHKYPVKRQASREFRRFAEAIHSAPVPAHEWFRDVQRSEGPNGLDLVMQCRCNEIVNLHVDAPATDYAVFVARNRAFIAHREAHS